MSSGKLPREPRLLALQLVDLVDSPREPGFAEWHRSPSGKGRRRADARIRR